MYSYVHIKYVTETRNLKCPKGPHLSEISMTALNYFKHNNTQQVLKSDSA